MVSYLKRKSESPIGRGIESVQSPRRQKQLQQPSGLVKLGANTLTLAGTNSYTGGTTVLSGTFIATSPEVFADGSTVIVGDFATVFSPIMPADAAEAPIATAPVPEPTTLLLLSASAGLTVLVRKWRRR